MFDFLTPGTGHLLWLVVGYLLGRSRDRPTGTHQPVTTTLTVTVASGNRGDQVAPGDEDDGGDEEPDPSPFGNRFREAERN